MTVAESSGAVVPHTPGPGAGIAGLEDVETSDLIMPTLRINHTNATFQDGLSGEEHAELEVILLGLIKQRVLWSVDIVEGDMPLCKSLNFDVGLPDPDRFPWEAAGFDPGNMSLPCVDCALKDWGSHPQRETPWCSEQHTFALLMPGDGSPTPALLSVQRSAIKPSRAYMSAFVKEQKPLFTVRTKMSLEARRRGTVNFAVPKFVRGSATDENLHSRYAAEYHAIRSYVSTPRDLDVDPADPGPGGAIDTGSVIAPERPETAPAAPPAAPPASPPPAPPTTPSSEAAPVTDDDLPF